MMSEQLHIIITRDTGKIIRFPSTWKKLRLLFAGAVLILLLLAVTSVFSISFFSKNRTFSSRLSELQQQLKVNEESMANHKIISETERLKLTSQLTAFKEEKAMMSTTVSELNERNELIEKVMDSIGISHARGKQTGTKNSGGPFIEQQETKLDDLLYRTDRYLKILQHLPLGRPVQGAISSRFGKRKDPINNKNAFHSGIDFHGKSGDKILATADGTVKRIFRNGGYGKYILIDHGNGYTTGFAHLKTYLVKKGERIKRGQVIGLVGNTGRSTGSHLHYEVALDKKPINPYKFMEIASLIKSNSGSPEKK